MDSRVSLKNTLILFLLIFTVSACDDNSGSQQSFRQIVEQEFMEADTDQNGVLGESEIDATIERDFNTMDTNMDGVITEADHVGSEYLFEVGPINRGELDDDTNGDEVLTSEEYSNEVQSRFIELADSNDDGQITLDEILAFHFGPNPGDG